MDNFLTSYWSTLSQTSEFLSRTQIFPYKLVLLYQPMYLEISQDKGIDRIQLLVAMQFYSVKGKKKGEKTNIFLSSYYVMSS